MSFLDQLGKKVSDAGKGVAQQTKNLTEIARLTSVIDTEEKMVAQSYTQIGKTYYENHKNDPDAECAAQIALVNKSLEKIAQWREQIQRIKDMGVRLMVLELPTTLMDLSVMDNAMARMMLETINNMMLELYASMAQAELEKKEKRQREGIEAKKLRGEWDDYGRPSVMKQETFDENFQSVISGKMTPTQLRKSLGMTHSTFYRYRKTFYEKYPELSNT